MNLQKELIAICRRHLFTRKDVRVTVPEPYIPFIPKRWNGVLVLAEAQNHGTRASSYLKWLKGASTDKRISRLYANKNYVGVWPWDDGSLKLAVAAALDAKSEETAVSNAVLWSQVGESGANRNPEEALHEFSASVWRELLKALKPRQIIAAGTIAKTVVSAAGSVPLHWRLPAPMGMNRVSGMFSEKDLLRRYPEVAKALRGNPEWLKSGYRQNKIFYACHAVSISRKGSA